MHTENLQKSVCMQPCVSQVWFYLEFPRVTCMCRFPSPMGSGSLVGFIWLKQNTLITRDLRVAHVHRTWGTYADVKSPYEMILSQRTLIQRCGNIPKSARKVLCVFFDYAEKKLYTQPTGVVRFVCGQHPRDRETPKLHLVTWREYLVQLISVILEGYAHESMLYLTNMGKTRVKADTNPPANQRIRSMYRSMKSNSMLPCIPHHLLSML